MNDRFSPFLIYYASGYRINTECDHEFMPAGIPEWNKRKRLGQILRNAGDIRFDEFINLARALGFIIARTRGSHHILKHPGIDELINLQNVRGKAKPYQVRQFLRLVEKYHLKFEDER